MRALRLRSKPNEILHYATTLYATSSCVVMPQLRRLLKLRALSLALVSRDKRQTSLGSFNYVRTLTNCYCHYVSGTC